MGVLAPESKVTRANLHREVHNALSGLFARELGASANHAEAIARLLENG